MRPVGCSGTLVTNYKSTVGKIPLERRPPLHRGGGLKSRTSMILRNFGMFNNYMVQKPLPLPKKMDHRMTTKSLTFSHPFWPEWGAIQMVMLQHIHWARGSYWLKARWLQMSSTHMPQNSSWRWNNPMPSAAVRLRSLPRPQVRSSCQADTIGQQRCRHWTLSSRPCHIPGAFWSRAASAYLMAQLTYRQINTG